MFSRSTPRLAPQYICGAYHKNGTNKEIGGCTSHQIRVEMLDIMLKKYIERVMGNSKQMIAELEKAVKKEPQSLKKDSSSLEATELELAKAKEELAAFNDQFLSYEGLSFPKISKSVVNTNIHLTV